MPLEIKADKLLINFNIEDFELELYPSISLLSKILITNEFEKFAIEMNSLWFEIDIFHRFFKQVKAIRNLEDELAELHDASSKFHFSVDPKSSLSDLSVSLKIKKSIDHNIIDFNYSFKQDRDFINVLYYKLEKFIAEIPKSNLKN